MHLYRLKLIFSRKLKEKSRTKSKLYKMHAFYGNMVIDEKSEIIREILLNIDWTMEECVLFSTVYVTEFTLRSIHHARCKYF